MPTHSAWGTDPDQPINFDDYCGPDEPNPAFTAALASIDRAVDSALNDDWMGDDEYDDAGQIVDPADRKQVANFTPMHLQRGRNRRLQRAYDRRRKVVELKIQGHTYEEIAITLGFNSIDGARTAFNRAMADTRDVAEEWRDLVLARNEKMIQVLAPMVDQGDLEAMDRIIKINAQTAKLTGMDKVTPIGHGVGERGETIKDVAERVQAVEDVNDFLSMLPNLVAMSPQPEGRVIDADGVEVHVVTDVGQDQNQGV